MARYTLIKNFLANPDKYDINRFYEAAERSEFRSKKLPQKASEKAGRQYKLF